MDNGVQPPSEPDEEIKEKKGDSLENSFNDKSSANSSVSGNRDLDAYMKNKEEGVF